MKFLTFLKNLFISKFWIKLIAIILAVFVVIILNVSF